MAVILAIRAGTAKYDLAMFSNMFVTIFENKSFERRDFISGYWVNIIT